MEDGVDQSQSIKSVERSRMRRSKMWLSLSLLALEFLPSLTFFRFARVEDVNSCHAGKKDFYEMSVKDHLQLAMRWSSVSPLTTTSLFSLKHERLRNEDRVLASPVSNFRKRERKALSRTPCKRVYFRQLSSSFFSMLERTDF